MTKPSEGLNVGGKGRRWPALAAGILASALLAHATAERPGRTLEDLRAPRRYWEDLAIGASQLFHQDGAAPIPVNAAAATDLRHTYRRHLIKAAEAEQLRPWQFWRTVRVKPFLHRDRVVPRDYDDPGRPALFGLGFRALGGVAPYFGLWVGALLTMPVLFWLAFELFAAGCPVAGIVLPILLGSWAHLVDLLALPYSAAGFYVLALLVLATLSVYAILGTSRTYRGLTARLLAAGSYFALCVLCRGSVLALLPGFLLVVALAAQRVLGPAPWRSTAAVAIAAISVFLLPHLAIRQAGHHAFWGDFWQGLGDFDNSKGHVWSDPALRQMLRREGMPLSRNVGVEFESDQSEDIARRVVLSHIQDDPLWFAAILVKRIGVTLVQAKLWAYAPAGGSSFHPTTRFNEGTIDRYYNIAATADVFVLGRWRRELPMGLLVYPAALVGVLGLMSLAVPRLRSRRADLGRFAGVIGCVALGAFALPVAIMTGALEMQAFALAYLVGVAFFLEGVVRLLLKASPRTL